MLIRFISLFSGMKSIKGILKVLEEEFIIVEDENEVKILRDKIKSVNLEGEI